VNAVGHGYMVAFDNGETIECILTASALKQELLLFLQTSLQNRHLKDLLMPLPNLLQQLNKRFMSSLRPLRIPMKMKNTSLLHKMKMTRKINNNELFYYYLSKGITRKVIMVLVMMKVWNQWREQSSTCMIQKGKCLGS
jgi:hypothetical protein